MNKFASSLITKARWLFANIAEQIFYYLVLFGSFIAWVYFESILIAVIVAVIGLALTWGISYLIEGNPKQKEEK